MNPSLLEELVKKRVPVHHWCGAVSVSVVASVIVSLIVEPTKGRVVVRLNTLDDMVVPCIYSNEAPKALKPKCTLG